MNTRTENINGFIYCAYCGQLLKNPNYGSVPEPPLICRCEKAKKELKLYDDLKNLYNSPLADNIIDLKVELYKKSLKGDCASSVTTESFTGTGCIVGSSPLNSPIIPV